MKISLCTKMFNDDLSPYREIEIPEEADELRLALVMGYDGEEIIYDFYRDGVRLVEKKRR